MGHPARVVDLPVAEMAALYRSGANVQAVADAFRCSYDRARKALASADVQIRQQHGIRVASTVIPPTFCLDCGERLDQPHPLGAHLPGCELALRRR